MKNICVHLCFKEGGRMKEVYVFGKPTCSICKDARNKIEYFKTKIGFHAEVKYFDMETVDGLTEGAYHEVSDVPTVIIVDEKEEIARWVKKPPVSEEFLPYLT